MSDSESLIMRESMLALSQHGCLVLRNNTGFFYTLDKKRKVFAGLGKGTSDLVGITPTFITPDMVGKTVGVFTAWETKTKTGRATEGQKNFISAVLDKGGYAGIARSAQEALDITRRDT